MWKFFKTKNVYAGPEPKKNKDKHSRMAAVYAGPEYFERESRKKAADMDMRDVYAGPMEMDEIYNNPDIDADDRPYPENLIEREEEEQAYPENLAEENENIKNMVEGVYAAPFVPGTICNQNETRMGLVYMAPIPGNGQSVEVAVSMLYAAPVVNPDNSFQVVNQPQSGEVKKCEVCGSFVKTNSKFCTSCGNVFADDLNTDAKCAECGAAIPSGAKFCPECGHIREGMNK